MYTTRFTVRGRGRFPLDMLRYDSCYPATQEDTRWVTLTSERELMLEKCHRYKGSAHVTKDRWQSFGWRVTEIFEARKVA